MTLLGFDEFVLKLRKALADYYGTDYSTSIHKTKKNNGLELTGICLKKRDSKLAPTIYAEGFYRDYQQSGNFGNIVFDVIKVINSSTVPDNLDVTFFSDYENISSKIEMKLINREKNGSLLKEIPYKEFLDMAVVFYYAFEDNQLENASILIRNEHLKAWGITIDQLYADAVVNAKRLCKPIINNMTEVVIDIMKKRGIEDDDEIFEMLSFMPSEDLMYVLTTENGRYGATAMLDKDGLESFAKQVNSDFFILPSSIHELILVPVKGGYMPDVLKGMVKEVNDNHVAQEEVLSYSVYMYSRAKRDVKIIETMA